MVATSERARPITELDLPLLEPMEPKDPRRFEMLARAREKSWIARTVDGGYSILRYDDVTAIHRDRRFVNGGGAALRQAGITDERFLARRPNPFLRSEGADHTRLRRLVTPAFSPSGADKLRPFMREELAAIGDAIIAEGRADLVRDLCDSFPVAVICELVGAPREDRKLFFNWTRDIFRVYGGGNIQASMARVLEAHRELDDYIEKLIEQRRKQPQAHLLDELIATEEAGDRLSNEELQSVVEAMLLAGTDTTRSQIGITFATLLQHPDQMAKLVAEPSLIPGAVEESLRYLSSVGGQPRYVHEDTEYRGVVFPAGTLLHTNFVSANVEPEIWGPDAERFDITRKEDRFTHLTFGMGRHFCLGNFIARAELQECLAALLPRLPNLRLDGEVEWKSAGAGAMWGAERVPVTFDRA